MTVSRPNRERRSDNALHIAGRIVECRLLSSGRGGCGRDWRTVARSLDCVEMRRKPWARAIGAFLATWFTLVANEHAPLNPCPMHGDLPLATAAPVTSHSHGDATPVETGHGDHAGGKCSCTGDCTSQQLSAPDVFRADKLFVTIAIGGPIGVAAASDLPTPPPFLRPFAIGPPSLRIG